MSFEGPAGIDRCQRTGPLTVIGDKGYASQAFHTAMQARRALIVRPRRKGEPGTRISQRLLALTAAIALNHKLGRPTRNLIAHTA